MDKHAPPEPPPLGPPPGDVPEDTARYVAWLKTKNKTATTPREDTNLRFGDWGFFDHDMFQDRAAIDKSNHVVIGSESGAWRAFLASPGLDPKEAMKRAVWLWNGDWLDPDKAKDLKIAGKITAPTLVADHDKMILSGFIIQPPSMNPQRLTITATSAKTTITFSK